jgi:hypothetical protein
MSDPVTIELNRDEALVLFDWLAHRADSQSKERLLSASEMVLANILCDLEKKLTEILDADYAGLLTAAQRAVLGDSG